MIQATLVGGRELIIKFEKFPGSLRAKLESTIKSLTFDLAKKVKQDFLSGQVLQRRTGRLSRSITTSFENDNDSFKGIVGTNVAYGAYHEFGFTGQETVKTFQRKMTMAFGRPLIKPLIVQVRSFTRNVNYKPHPFLRPALEEMRPEIEKQINEVATNAAKETFGS